MLPSALSFVRSAVFLVLRAVTHYLHRRYLRRLEIVHQLVLGWWVHAVWLATELALSSLQPMLCRALPRGLQILV